MTQHIIVLCVVALCVAYAVYRIVYAVRNAHGRCYGCQLKDVCNKYGNGKKLFHHGKVDQVVVSQILHVVTMSLGAIMALPGAALLYMIIVVESSDAADDEDNLAVAFMDMQS